MLNQDFKEFIQLLNDNSVRYLVVDGYAVALHGYSRYTKDLGVWIEAFGVIADGPVSGRDDYGTDPSAQCRLSQFVGD